MPQRILALDITDSDLTATVLQTTFRDYHVEGFFREQLTPASGATEAQLRRFVEQHAKAGDTVLSSLPGDRVTWRTLFLPFRDSKRLAQTIPFELESNVPFGLEDVVVDYQVLRRDQAGTTVLAALVPKEDLERHLELLQRVGADPKVVDVGPLATLNTLSLLTDLPPTFAFLDLTPSATTVALYREGELVGLRTLKRGASVAVGGSDGSGAGAALGTDVGPPVMDVHWTLLALNGAPLDEQLPCYVAGERTVVDAVEGDLAEQLPVDVRRLDRVRLRNLGPEESALAPAFSSSLGLALREIAPANSLGVNFRRGEYTFQRSQQELQRGLRGVAFLAVLIVALILADLYVEYRTAAVRLAAIDAQIRNVFSATLPEVRRVANPVAQLKEEIDALQAEVEILNGVVPVSSSTSVDILRAISAAIPNKIRVDNDEYIMDPDTVRLRANTDTFESVDTIKQELLDTGFFSEAQVKDAKAAKKGQSGVDFRMTLVLTKDFSPRGGQK